MPEVTREAMIIAVDYAIHKWEQHNYDDEWVRALKAARRELEAGGWRPRETAPDTDDPILGYSPIAGDPDEDEQAGHYAITEGSFLRQGGWASCTLWQPITPPTTSGGSDK